MVYMEQIHVGILSLVRSWAARDLPALLSDTVSWELVELIERCAKTRQADRQIRQEAAFTSEGWVALWSNVCHGARRVGSNRFVARTATGG